MIYHDDHDILDDDQDIFTDDDGMDCVSDEAFEKQEGCLFPDHCICVGDHTTDECLTAEMADAYEQEVSIHNLSSETSHEVQLEQSRG